MTPKTPKNPTTPREFVPEVGLPVFPGAEGFGTRTIAGRANEILLKRAGGFEEVIEGNLKVLLENGLDKELWVTFRRTLKGAS